MLKIKVLSKYKFDRQ